MEELRAKYNSGTTEQNDNGFLIGHLRTAIGARNISKLSDIQINSKRIERANTNFRTRSMPKAALTSVNDSYFQMSHSLAPDRLVRASIDKMLIISRTR